jgi:uncharacterized integral membrane protein
MTSPDSFDTHGGPPSETPRPAAPDAATGPAAQDAAGPPVPDGGQRELQQPGLDHRGRVRRSRVGGVWVAVIALAVTLILLLIFILQNSQRVTVHFLGLSGHLPLAVALLFAAVLAVLLVAIPGTVRIVQLRRALRKNAQPR